MILAGSYFRGWLDFTFGVGWILLSGLAGSYFRGWLGFTFEVGWILLSAVFLLFFLLNLTLFITGFCL